MGLSYPSLYRFVHVQVFDWTCIPTVGIVGNPQVAQPFRQVGFSFVLVHDDGYTRHSSLPFHIYTDFIEETFVPINGPYEFLFLRIIVKMHFKF